MSSLGHVGSESIGGNFSNLSALAPPFTRLNPNPNSNPLLQYPESTYAFEPFSGTWKYASPSAPTSEQVMDSTGMTNMPFSSDYQFSASMFDTIPSTAFNYGGGLKPRHSPWVPSFPFVDNDGRRYDVGPDSQINYMQSLQDLEYGPSIWADNSGFVEGKRAKRVELDAKFSSEKVSGLHSYKKQPYHGQGSGNLRSSKEDTSASYKKFNQFPDREDLVGRGRLEDKSFLDQDLSFIPYKSNKTHTTAPNSTNLESSPVDISCEINNIFSNYQNSGSRKEKCARSSPAVVIRAPPARNDNVACFDSWDFSNSNPSKNLDQKSISEINGQNLISSSSIESPDFVVDSPCWKGAPSSRFPSLDIEAGTSNHVKKKMDEEYSSFVSSDGEGNKNAENEFARNDILPTLDTTLDSIWPSKEKGSSEVPKSNNLRCGFGEEESSTVFNDVSGDSSVAVHAAEKVLDSPSSQEDSTEEGKIRPETRLDVPTMIKAIHNLSELLLFHLSKDSCDIDEQYIGTLKQTRDNLDSCLSKKIVKTAIDPEPNNPVGDASKKFGELHVSTILGSLHTTNEEKKNCSTSEKKNCSTSEKKDEKSRVSSPLVDDLDTTRDDDMAKAIKKVLDENFNFDEEMHSQTLLFKNLWLEAEAKLCSVSYKARFDRMKIEMEKSKPKSPKANEDVAQMMTKIHFSPDLSKLTPKAHDVTIPEPSIPTSSFSSTTGSASDTAEASVMARFNILKSREDNLILKPMNVKEEHQQEQPENLDGDSVSSVMSRFNALISREEKLKSINVEKQQQQQQPPPPETSLKDESEDEILGKYGSNPDGFGPFGYESGTNDSTVVHSLDHIKIINQCLKDESEDEILGKYGSNSDGFGRFGYDSVPNDSTVVHSLDHIKIIDQYYAGGRDSSSSDWEHVPKDDFAWKNFLA